MTYEETLSIMAVLKAAYPAYYKGMTKQEALAAVDLWASMFAEDDVALVTAAVKALIATDEKGFPPHIGAVKAKMRLLSEKPSMTEQEAWALVSKAIKNSGYGSREEFAKLPPEVKSVVHSPEQLREWGMMDSDTVNSVVASNFMRSYRERMRHQKEMAALPGDVRALAAKLVSHLALEGGFQNALGD
jgi:hypothetical protein